MFQNAEKHFETSSCLSLVFSGANQVKTHSARDTVLLSASFIDTIAAGNATRYESCVCLTKSSPQKRKTGRQILSDCRPAYLSFPNLSLMPS